MLKVIFTYGFLINLVASLAETDLPDNMNAILIKCPKNNLNLTCETHLIVNIHMNPSFDLEKSEKFWVVDKVFDPSKGTTSKIISPYLLVVGRGEPVVMYPLQFFKTINQNKISKKPLEKEDSTSDIGVSASCANNEQNLETNMKGVELEMNSSRLKRNQLSAFPQRKSFLSNLFGKERLEMPRQIWNMNTKNKDNPNDISSLGLVQVMDTASTKNPLEIPGDIFQLQKDYQLLKSIPDFNQKPKFEDRSKHNGIESKPRFDIKNINTQDNSDIRYFSEDLKHHDHHYTEGNLKRQHHNFKTPEEESALDLKKHDPQNNEAKPEKEYTNNKTPEDESEPDLNNQNPEHIERHYEKGYTNFKTPKDESGPEHIEQHHEKGYTNFKTHQDESMPEYIKEHHEKGYTNFKTPEDESGPEHIEGHLGKGYTKCKTPEDESLPEHIEQHHEKGYTNFKTPQDESMPEHIEEHHEKTPEDESGPKHIEGHHEKGYPNFKRPEDESVPDFLLFDRFREEARRKKIQKTFENDYVPPGKTQMKADNLSHKKESESKKFENPTKSLSHESKNEDLNLKSCSNKNSLPNEIENEKYQNNYPLESEKENNYMKAPSKKFSHANDFSRGHKKQLRKYKPQSVKEENNFENNFKSHSNVQDLTQDSEIDLYNLRTPMDDLYNLNHYGTVKENNYFKTSDYTFPDLDGIDNNYLNSNAEDPYKHDHYLSNDNAFSTDNIKPHFDAPMKSLYSEEFLMGTKYDYTNLPSDNTKDFSWTQGTIGDETLDFIINQHMNQKLPKNFDFNTLNTLNDLTSEYSMPDNILKYLDFDSNYKINPYSTYPKKDFARSVPSLPRSRKRSKRSKTPEEDIENSDDSQSESLDQNEASDSDSMKSIEDNGDIPCDTCGGKNKKKGEKNPSRYCSAAAEPKSQETKMEDVIPKLNDVVPCDTCGGKNKKPDGKPIPPDMPSESKLRKPKNEENRLPDDMIPCEDCKKDSKCRDGNLKSASCGCISNPSVCDCQSSKTSRASNSNANDKGYTVFSLENPVPFLTTKLRVFRRRHNTWWRVLPIVNLDTVSGIYANKDLSAVLISHVDMISLEKSTGFSNRKLVVPKIIDRTIAKKRHLSVLKELHNSIGNSFLLDISSKDKDISIEDIKNYINLNREKEKKKGGLTTRSIKGLGNFPVSMNALENCPHKDKHLCLNILEEKVPEFSIKVKIPFRENALVMRNKHFVKISRIITDATTKDALQISIDVINKGFEAQEFSIYVSNCKLSSSTPTTTSALRLLQPDISQTVTLLMPLILASKKNKQFKCDVLVKPSESKGDDEPPIYKDDPKVGVIAKRTMAIKPHSRCFCVWRCRCHCIGKLETFINYNACERMDEKSEKEAGLIYNCPGIEHNDVCIRDIDCDRVEEVTCNLTCQIITITVLLLILLLLLGILKAIFGICIQCIGRCGFDTVQPGRTYECSSCIRIFLVNCFFFIIYPFACWCKFFRPKTKDLMEASYDWDCTSQTEATPECSCDTKESHSSCRLHGGQDQNLNNNLVLAFAPLHENGLFKDEKSDDEESHLFILEVLEESKSSLTKMMSQVLVTDQKVEQCEEGGAHEIAAEELVESLKNSQVAYRTMSSPVGGVIDIPENCQYCVKGFFLQTLNSTYEFMSYQPLTQFVGISEENEVRKLPQPKYIHSNEFSKIYNDKMDVYKAADLSVVPPLNVPCINIDHGNHLENSFVKLAKQQELIKANQP